MDLRHDTLIYIRRKELVLDEPSSWRIRQEAARDARTIHVIPEIRPSQGDVVAIRPMKDGVADFVAEQMLKRFIEKVHDDKLFSSAAVVLSLRLDAAARFRESAIGAGRGVYLIEEPMAAATSDLRGRRDRLQSS